ncbi:MAG: hypothetical protein AB7P20_21050 [Rhizobiaceae bacterium]
MAEEPDNLVLKLLREMRSILDEHSAMHREHREGFADIRKAIEDWKETTAAGVGFAAHANIRTDVLEKEIADLKKPIDRIERSH